METWIWILIAYIIGCGVAYLAIAWGNDNDNGSTPVIGILFSWIIVAVIVILYTVTILSEYKPTLKRKKK